MLIFAIGRSIVVETPPLSFLVVLFTLTNSKELDYVFFYLAIHVGKVARVCDLECSEGYMVYVLNQSTMIEQST